MLLQIWLLFFLRAVAGLLYDSGYVPLFIAPDGYSVYEPDGNGTGVYSYVVKPDKICQVRIVGSKEGNPSDEFYYVLQYRVINPVEIHSTDAAVYSKDVFMNDKNGYWFKITHIKKFKNHVPTLCFWDNEGPNIIVRLDYNMNEVYLYRNHDFHEHDLTFQYDQLAYDSVAHRIYAFEDLRLYSMPVKKFVESITQSISWNEAFNFKDIRPLVVSKFFEWTDMIVTEGRVYFLHDKGMYEMASGKEYFLGHYGSDRFNHTLVPTFEMHNGVRDDEISQYRIAVSMLDFTKSGCALSKVSNMMLLIAAVLDIILAIVFFIDWRKRRSYRPVLQK